MPHHRGVPNAKSAVTVSPDGKSFWALKEDEVVRTTFESEPADIRTFPLDRGAHGNWKVRERERFIQKLCHSSH